jgi:hypothetical protein
MIELLNDFLANLVLVAINVGRTKQIAIASDGTGKEFHVGALQVLDMCQQGQQ